MLKKEISIQRKEYDWPENYYMNTAPERRRAFLDEAMQADPSPENELRLLLWQKRYCDAKGKMDGTDHFLKMWVNLPYAAKQKDAIFGKRYTKSYLKEMEDTFQLQKLADNPALKDVWFREFIHFVCLYIEISQKDPTYSTTLFGIGKLSDESLASKLAQDLCEKTIHLPEVLQFRERQELLAQAAKEAYLLYFPEKKELYEAFETK